MTGTRLNTKTAIVTGGASGFGKGIVEKFIAEGANVMIADINDDAGEALADHLGDQCTYVHCDVSVDADIAQIVKKTLGAFGKLDIMVNNAGMGHLPTALEKVDEVLFDRLLAINIKSIYLSALQCAPLFKEQKHGVFLNMASTAGVSPRPNLTWYNMTKGAVITATRSMAVELAPDNIRVNALNPVAGETPMLKTFMGEDTPQIRQKFLSTIPLGRFSTPQDLGNAACFLCSDEASMITGVAMEVDGGRCI